MNREQADSKLANAELEFWQAPVSGKKMRFVAELHESVLGDLTEALANTVKLRFSGLTQAQPVRLLEHLPQSSYVVLFGGEEMPYAGAVVFSPQFAQQVVAGWFSLSNVSGNRGLTPLEESSFWQAAQRLTQVFLSAYASGGFHQASIVSRGRLRDMAEALANSREIVAFNYAAEAQGAERTELPLCVLLDIAMASRLVGPQREDESVAADSALLARAARRLPIETSVVLGSFKVLMVELMALKPGDVVLLPDQNEARLATSDNVDVFPIEVELDDHQGIFRILSADDKAA